VHSLWYFAEKNFGNLLVGGILAEVYWDKELLGFLIDITNIDTTLMGKEDPIALIIKNKVSLTACTGGSE
jgi:hypothetical protein